MPYTPPARSPAALHHHNPINHHAVQFGSISGPASPGPASPGAIRPQLPRSHSSTAYLNKHRRSPSLPNVAAADLGANNGTRESAGFRQPPPPLTDRRIPAGAILSPPDSTLNSSDDEAPLVPDDRADDYAELHEAVKRTLDTNNNAGPGSPAERADTTSALLSDDSRKFSHSRSATESHLNLHASSLPNSVNQSDGSDDELEFASSDKPPLVRKKSGELVKPAIRPHRRRKHSSMPGTPTFSKAVHFNDDIEQVRHFLQVDRPIAVSAGTSPAEGYEEETEFPFGPQSQTKWELRLKNFPSDSHERLSRPARVERLYLSADQKSLLGVVVVANLAFHKSVVARFTFDYWKTTSEVTAEYNNDPRSARQDGNDQFTFSLKLSDQANLHSRTLLLCVRYIVNGTEHWDNNDGINFQVDFARVEKEQAKVSPVIPRSRHNAASSRTWSMSSLDDDFANGIESTPIRFRKATADPTQGLHHQSNPHFSTRYDFSASLSAALSQAQKQVGSSRSQRPKLKEAAPRPPSSTIPSRTGVQGTTSTPTETPRPDTLIANRQTLDSRAYQEFVSKYCFFGSNKIQPQAKGKDLPPNEDGAFDDGQSTLSFPQPNAAGSIGSTPDDSGDTTPLQAASHLERLSFGYPFSQDQRPGMITPDYTPTAIPG